MKKKSVHWNLVWSELWFQGNFPVYNLLFLMVGERNEIKWQEAYEITGATSWSSLALLQYQKLLHMFDLLFNKQSNIITLFIPCLCFINCRIVVLLLLLLLLLFSMYIQKKFRVQGYKVPVLICFCFYRLHVNVCKQSCFIDSLRPFHFKISSFICWHLYFH